MALDITIETSTDKSTSILRRYAVDMHPEDIKAAIRKKGGSLAALTRAQAAAGKPISIQALSQSLQARVSERCEYIIADFLEVHPREIWPSRYRANGTRIGNACRQVAA
ncbi:helix-turn-helix domain-containing protein [uncultured Sphingopyxis sp.]|uniref:helix-turn-helix domain-containing protein n=1 Tax=uncultured Sphingopyxis sp. TaxID=310581 RepID=UPI002592FB91|nr:helix-turn-helix domain-containing protein [uncultured Sphingopyxis sp.]